MLKLILGTAGTGKSYYIKNQIYSHAQKGEKSLLIVPEQFSKTGETEIFTGLEKSQFSLVRVFSFNSLLRKWQEDGKKTNKKLLTDAGKAVFAKKSLDVVYKQLMAYSAQRQNIGFSFEISGMFDEFKRSGITPGELFSIADKGKLQKDKLKDIAIIYGEYIAQMADEFCDNEDMLSLLGENLPLSYTEHTHIFIDSFESFTYSQYKIIQKMLENAIDVTVAFSAEKLWDDTNGTGYLCYTTKTASRLTSLAKKVGVTVVPPVILTKQTRFKSNELKAIDNLLLQREYSSCTGGENAYVTIFKNQFSEVSAVCAQINKLVKQGYKYDDIAVVSTQLEKYENQLQESFTQGEIPYFIDQNRIISSFSGVVLVKAILDIMGQGLNEDTILPLLKTQLTHFDKETVDELENYLYIWQEQALDFSKAFEMPINGLNGRISEEENQERLSKLNALVSEIYNMFNSYIFENQPTEAEKILTNAYEILTQLDSQEIIKDIITVQQYNTQKGQLIFRQWELVIAAMEQLYEITRGELYSKNELSELFMLLISGTQLGFAPQTQDCVLISSPQRMKIDAVKIVFIIGAAQECFPQTVESGGILSIEDRQLLKENNFEISSNFEEKYSFENLYFYKTLTTAQEKIYISCCERNIDSKDILSAQIESIRDNLSLPPLTLEIWDYAINKAFFMQYLGEEQEFKGKGILPILGIEGQTFAKKEFMIFDTDMLLEILGDNMKISPTASESYYKCAFSYFLQKILNIRPIEKALLSQRESGNYLHFIVKEILEKYKAEYSKTPWDIIVKDTAQVIEVFIRENYPIQLTQTQRFKALNENMHTNALQLLKHIYHEQASSSFVPIAFEASIRFEDGIMPVVMKLDDGNKVSVVGDCDRIDLFEADGIGYIRIIDYKTGTKDFKLDEVYNGLSNQLMLYMEAVLQGGKKAFFDEMGSLHQLKPGAVVYQPSDAEFKFDEDAEMFMPVGMAVDSSVISKAFDDTKYGRFGIIKGESPVKSVKGSQIVSERLFNEILDYSKNMVKSMAQNVYNGEFDALPLSLTGDLKACRWCGYSSICQEKSREKTMQKHKFVEKKEENDG